MTKGSRTEVSLIKSELEADLLGMSELAEIVLKQTAAPNVAFPCRRNFLRTICKRWLLMWLRFIRSSLQKLSRTRWVCEISSDKQFQPKEQPQRVFWWLCIWNPGALGRFPHTAPLYLSCLSYSRCLSSTIFLSVRNA